MSKDEATDVRLSRSEQDIKDQWQVLNDIRDSLSEIKQSLAKMEGAINKVEDLERRIKSLEAWRTFLIGAWGVVSLLGYLAWDYFKTGRHP